MSVLKRFFVEESGQDASEYALVVGVISLGIFAAAALVTGALNNWYTSVATFITTNMVPTP